jgi:hypothetical protein
MVYNIAHSFGFSCCNYNMDTIGIRYNLEHLFTLMFSNTKLYLREAYLH